ncbi:MAG: TRAP transporter substrate-binding protein [Pseudomonadota bacterium]
MKIVFAALALVLAAILGASHATAQDVTLRVHHFMSSRAPLHANFLLPWADRLSEASDGRIKVEVFESMSLGGGPADLYGQAADGAVDIILTLPGYTPGRFDELEVFELPFMMRDATATSGALYDLISTRLQDTELDETRILAAWVHGPGIIHANEPINSLEDIAGMELRGPTRLVTDLLGELGATPVGMPLPAIPENLAKGVISGAVVPWEIVPSIRLQELVNNHTELSGDRALYTATFILAMNWDSYDAMPEDLRNILDEETGKALSLQASGIVLAGDAKGRELSGSNNIVTLDEAETARWVEAAQPVYDRFISRAADEGFDGAAAIAEANALISANE